MKFLFIITGNTYTEKCDIFSWGIILWEVLTRRLPFDEIRGNDLRVLWAIHSGQRPPPILDCPEILESLMARCWNKDASIRPTMAEIVTTMQFIQQFFPIAEDPLPFPDDDLDAVTTAEDEEDKTSDDLETLPSSCYASARENVSKSEVDSSSDVGVEPADPNQALCVTTAERPRLKINNKSVRLKTLACYHNFLLHILTVLSRIFRGFLLKNANLQTSVLPIFADYAFSWADKYAFMYKPRWHSCFLKSLESGFKSG